MTDMTVAQEIYRQLGGKRFRAMTGARNFTGDENSLSFMIPRVNGIQGVTITLNGSDLYDMEFVKFSKKPPYRHTIETETDIFFDTLQDAFTRQTGLYTQL